MTLSFKNSSNRLFYKTTVVSSGVVTLVPELKYVHKKIQFQQRLLLQTSLLNKGSKFNLTVFNSMQIRLVCMNMYLCRLRITMTESGFRRHEKQILESNLNCGDKSDFVQNPL